VSGPATRPTELDGRLAALLGTLDAPAGFEARLRARLARAQPAADAPALVRARARVLEQRRATERALRRALRLNVLLVAGGALAALGPAWLLGRILGPALAALASGGSFWIVVATGVALAAWLAALLRRSERGDSLFGLPV
jgi:hypothetical protein